MNLIKTEIGLSNGQKFTIYHNLPDTPSDHISIMSVVNEWLKTSTSQNNKNLAKFINALGYTAYTEKQFKRQGITTRKIK